MSAPSHLEHGVEQLCDAGTALYARALREGRVPVREAGPAPCLLRFGLLNPSVDELDQLEPVAPAVALHRFLSAAEDRIAAERRHEAELLAKFEPLLRTGTTRSPDSGTPSLRVHSGTERINQVITEAVVEADREVLAVQPYTSHSSDRVRAAQAVALPRDQAFLDRGGRIRTLYQHTQRHSPLILAYREQLVGDVEARTLDEVTDRLIVVDRAVAFVPAGDDGRLALEVRHPALISYFVTTFDRLWHLATPMSPHPVTETSRDGVTPRQRAIAALLVEGHTDAVIADRLGLNIRTAREHIAKLAATLGSGSRAQLGYLIARSGILDQEG